MNFPTIQEKNHETVFGMAMARMGDVFGTKKASSMWKNTTAQHHKLKELEMSNLDQLKDCFFRINPSSGLDPQQFVDAFAKIDANGDGRVSWEEFSDYVLSESLQRSEQLHDGMEFKIFEDPQQDDESSTQSQHRDMILDIAYLKDLKRYVTCSKDGSVKSWGSASRRLIHSLQVSHSKCKTWATCCSELKGLSAASLVQGAMAVFTSSRAMLLVELKNFHSIHSIELPEGTIPLCCTSFNVNKSQSPSDKVENSEHFLAVGDEEGKVTVIKQSARMLNATRVQELEPLTLQLHRDHVTCCLYIPTLDSLLSTSLDGSICLYELPSKQTKRFRGHAKAVFCAVFCSNFNYVASGGQERVIILWNPYTLKRITALHGHNACITFIVFNAKHSHILSISRDKDVIVWDPKTYQLLLRVKDDSVYRPDNVFSSAYWNETETRLVVGHSRLQIRPYKGDLKDNNLSLATHKAPLVAAMQNPVFQNLITIDFLGLVIVWSLDDGEQITAFKCKQTKSFDTTAVSFDKTMRRLIVGSANGRVYIFNWNSGVKLNELVSDAEKEITCISVCEASQRTCTVAAGWDKKIYLWVDPPDTFHQQPMKRIDLMTAMDVMRMVWIQPMATLALAIYDGSVRTWSTQGSWKKSVSITLKDSEATFETQGTAAINCLTWMRRAETKEPFLVTAHMDGMIRLWQPLDGRQLGEFHAGHRDLKINVDGSRTVLPVITMDVDRENNLMITGDGVGQVRGTESSSVCKRLVKLKLKVVEAAELPAADANGFSDPYAIIHVNRKKFQTEVIFKDLNPVWNQEFEVELGLFEESEVNVKPTDLFIEVLDQDKFGSDDMLGTLNINTADVRLDELHDSWYDMQDPEPEMNNYNGKYGRIRLQMSLQVHWNEPTLMFEWQAHENELVFIALSQSSESSKSLVVTCAKDNLVKLWTISGVVIGCFGHDVWNMQLIKDAITHGAERQAQLILNEKMRHELEQEQLRKWKEELRKNLEDAQRLEEERTRMLEYRAAKIADREKREEYIRVLEESHNVNDRIYSKILRAGIPEDTYQILSQPLLDSIIEGKGRTADWRSVVSTKLRIHEDQGGPSEPVKRRSSVAEHSKPTGLSFERAYANFTLADVDNIPWQEVGQGGGSSIPRRPRNTVASLYRSEEGGRQTGTTTNIPPQTREDVSASAGSAIKAEALSASPTVVSDHNRRLSSSGLNGEGNKPRAVGILEPQGLSSNVRKLLTTSLPTSRPRGSWTFDDITLKESAQGAGRRQIPRFDVSAVNPDKQATSAEAMSSRMGASYMWSCFSLTPKSDHRNRAETLRLHHSPYHVWSPQGRPHSLLEVEDEPSSRATRFSSREFDAMASTPRRVLRVKKLDLSNLRPSAQLPRTPHPPSDGKSSAPRQRPQTSRLASSRRTEEQTPAQSSSSVPRHRLRPFTAREGKHGGGSW